MSAQATQVQQAPSKRVLATEDAWRWPVDPAAYDRTPVLRPAERDALAVVIALRDTHRRRNEQAMAAVDRLLRPLWDVLAATDTHPTTVKHAEGVVLREMHVRQRPYWVWTPAVWAAIFCDDNAYGRTYRTRAEQYRRRLLLAAYVLCGIGPPQLGHQFFFKFAAWFAGLVFGTERVQAACDLVIAELVRWGYREREMRLQLPVALGHLMLCNRSPVLADLTTERLQVIHDQHLPEYLRKIVVTTSRALASLGCIAQPLEPAERVRRRAATAATTPTGCAPEWAHWAARWRDTSTREPRTRQAGYGCLLQVGRWLAATHPAVTSPAQWTRELAAAYVAAVDRATVGQWGSTTFIPAHRLGAPMAANTKKSLLSTVRTFFRDLQEWNWIPRRFDPVRSFLPPWSVRSVPSTNPRVIADDVWAKLLWAGLHLTAEDLPAIMWTVGDKRAPDRKRLPMYPLEMVRAVTLVWLFCGLRSDEIRRLHVGCIRWQHAAQLTQRRQGATRPGGRSTGGTGSEIGEGGEGGVDSHGRARDAVCWLDVPVHKQGGAFTKPVDRVVGEAIAAWEAVRPEQPLAVDRKTGEAVRYLFAYRGHQLGGGYLNDCLIPLLCRKAGLPRGDARGSITSHRARSTIATQLFNAKEPLSLFELQEWLGHRSPHSTQYYARITPTKLAKSYEQAGYFGRNLRAIEVLVDQAAVRSGAAAAGEPWKYYDLGHGYCTYDFFAQCPHRMACAKCSFYRPKPASADQLLEGKANLLRLRQEIPLLDEERAAVEDGVAALDRLLARLVDVPPPDGGLPPGHRHQGREEAKPSRRVVRRLPVLPAAGTAASIASDAGPPTAGPSTMETT